MSLIRQPLLQLWRLLGGVLQRLMRQQLTGEKGGGDCARQHCLRWVLSAISSLMCACNLGTALLLLLLLLILLLLSVQAVNRIHVCHIVCTLSHRSALAGGRGSETVMPDLTLVLLLLLLLPDLTLVLLLLLLLLLLPGRRRHKDSGCQLLSCRPFWTPCSGIWHLCCMQQQHSLTADACVSWQQPLCMSSGVPAF
jgi:hypothetical protein